MNIHFCKNTGKLGSGSLMMYGVKYPEDNPLRMTFKGKRKRKSNTGKYHITCKIVLKS